MKTLKMHQTRGQPFQLIEFETSVATDASGLMSTVNLGIQDNDGNLILAVAVAHDGMRLAPHEKAIVLWTFLRPL